MNTPFIIGIAGGSASGKTTFCNALSEALSGHSVRIFYMDDYFKYEQIPIKETVSCFTRGSHLLRIVNSKLITARKVFTAASIKCGVSLIGSLGSGLLFCESWLWESRFFKGVLSPMAKIAVARQSRQTCERQP